MLTRPGPDSTCSTLTWSNTFIIASAIRSCAVIVRREVGVAAFGRGRHEAAVEVVEHRLAEPGAGGDHRGVAVRDRDALLQHRELVGLEHRHRVAERLEIVEQDAARQAAALGDRPHVHQPRHVAQPRDVVGDRAGHPEARRPRSAAG